MGCGHKSIWTTPLKCRMGFQPGNISYIGRAGSPSYAENPGDGTAIRYPRKEPREGKNQGGRSGLLFRRFSLTFQAPAVVS